MRDTHPALPIALTVSVTSIGNVLMGIADPRALVVWLFVQLFAGLLIVFVAGFRLRRAPAHVPQTPETQPPAPLIINLPAPAPTPAPAYSAPQPVHVPQRPVQPGDFAEPKPDPQPKPQASIFFDAYTPPRSAFDPLVQPMRPMPPLEREQAQTVAAPWDDITPSFTGPLHTGPLLERRPPRPGEIDMIKDVYAETGSLNKTIQRVYGTKDGTTHGWIKGAIETP